MELSEQDRAQGSPLDPTWGRRFMQSGQRSVHTPPPAPGSFLHARLTLHSGSSEPSALCLVPGGSWAVSEPLPDGVCLRDAGLPWGRAPPPAWPCV